MTWQTIKETRRNHNLVIEFKKNSHFAGIGKSLMIIKFFAIKRQYCVTAQNTTQFLKIQN